MEKKKQNKKKWSNKFKQAKIGTWNCWSLSSERYHYCKGLKYDILGLTELHNEQAKEQYKHKTWIHSAPAAVDAHGKCSDPAAGVAIMLSPRMAEKILDTGHVGTRIAWVRLKGPVCNLFYIVAYIYTSQRESHSAESRRHHRAALGSPADSEEVRMRGPWRRFQLPIAKVSVRMRRQVVHLSLIHI